MTRYVALLRAVNVGGTGRLAMADLRTICAAAGFTRVETYIASGNVVFDSKVGATKVKALLHSRLAAHLGKPIGVVVRTEAEMAAVLKGCPFTDMEPKHTYAIFLDAPPPSDALQRAAGRTDERLALGEREIFVHFPRGMGRSKLRIPASKDGTARNMTTVAMLAEMASKAREPS
jgi:uncharacterized protein (DUF1697 family)